MNTIEVDFDVYKQLTIRRETEDVSYNDVIRELLGLIKANTVKLDKPNNSAKDDWISKGVRFPAGTEFRANYKGQMHLGRVEKGALIVNEERFTSPSPAANFITKTSTDGWKFWHCKFPNESSWKLLKSLRPNF